MVRKAKSLSSRNLSYAARKLFSDEFIQKYTQLEADLQKTPMQILVWGPAPGAGELYDKRVQIRDELRAMGCYAVFSEEIDAEIPLSPAISSKTREMMQAEAADAVVVIQGSPGAIAEVHDMAGFTEDVICKMIVFIDEQHRTGYSFNGALRELGRYGNVHTYSFPRDIRECHLCTAVLENIGMRRARKWQRGMTH